MILDFVVLDALALLALQSLFNFVIESIRWVLIGILLFFIDKELLEQVGEILSGILLLACAELLVTFSD